MTELKNPTRFTIPLQRTLSPIFMRSLITIGCEMKRFEGIENLITTSQKKKKRNNNNNNSNNNNLI